MKKSKFLVAFLMFVFMGFTSYTQNHFATSISSDKLTTDKTSRFPIFSVKADLVSIDGNRCFTAQVRVYSIDKYGQSLLATSDKVQVCNEDQKSKSTSKDNCSGTLPNADFVLGVENLGDPCLYQRLKDNKEIYELYLEEIQEFKDKY